MAPAGPKEGLSFARCATILVALSAECCIYHKPHKFDESSSSDSSSSEGSDTHSDRNPDHGHPHGEGCSHGHNGKGKNGEDEVDSPHASHGEAGSLPNQEGSQPLQVETLQKQDPRGSSCAKVEDAARASVVRE